MAAVLIVAVGIQSGTGDEVNGQWKSKKAGKAEKASVLADAPEKAEIGILAPDFTLTDIEGKEHNLASYVEDGNIVVLEWFNPDCPFVKKHHLKNKSMAETYKSFSDQNVVWLAVNSGGPGREGNGIERNKKAVAEYSIEYPVLLDETGAVGKMYGAKTTPQIFVITKGTLVYNGPLDDVPNPGKLGEKNYVKEVLEGCCAGKDVEPSKIRSYGCNVKYAS
ncbi:MAG: redoxin domain-containing protein [Planctomycetota bacterium]|jgi:peroxiredoxin